MRTRQMRKSIDNEEVKEIRSLIEQNGMRFVLLNNGIFDELFSKEIEGVIEVKLARNENGELKKDGNKKLYDINTGMTRMTELEVITFVFLQFMMTNKFTLSYKKLAMYLGCSEKQLQYIIHRLKYFKAPCNAKYSSRIDGVEIVEEDKQVKLITEKQHKAYDPSIKKSKRMVHWYTNYIPNHKKETVDGKEKVNPVKFFMMTINEFDLFTQQVLSKQEFLTYMFLLKAYNPSKTDEQQMWWRYSTLAEELNIKMVSNVQKYIEKLMNTEIDGKPLIKEIRPKNYELQILKGEEPSSRFIPVYNPEKLLEMNLEKTEVDSDKKEMNSNKKEMDLEKTEMDFSKKETKSTVWEDDFSNKEVGYKISDIDFDEIEIG
ncbi:hypothetical protein M3936_03785 [Sutcliffiella horikoshii]|uniref:hypothetical protein n=1 Tax=Sutcliffiella horikoshii TaxID=79883 RepID=UPI00203E45EC|nr:hypothetical protein [Sutcliffiella horikoshii]MCM3616698.1 hypothetical protein [Sutcliffiella horikoshii]